MNIIYNKLTGIIQNAISNDQDYKMYYESFGIEFINNLDTLQVENVPYDLRSYKIVNGELIEMTEIEKNEVSRYGRILTEEEREELENIPKQPTIDELQEQIKELNMVVDTMLGVDIE